MKLRLEMNEADHLINDIIPILFICISKRGSQSQYPWHKHQFCSALACRIRTSLIPRKSATISIDDFYLTAEGQAKGSVENSGNSLLQVEQF
ncbi:unnamed protein product [Amaranthus hypochondriacus]